MKVKQTINLKSKVKFFVAIVAIIFASCQNEMDDVIIDRPDSPRETGRTSSIARGYSRPVILGEQKNNPFSVENMRLALQTILEHGDADALEISTRSAESMLLNLPATDLYVRFLPADSVQMALLVEKRLDLFDFPLDFEIVQHGDYWRDPTLSDDAPFTWQYTVVKPCFVFPYEIQYEILAELFIPENSEFFTETEISPYEVGTRARMVESWTDIQYNNLLRAMLHVSFALTGNGDEILSYYEGEETRATYSRCVRRCILFACWTDCDVWYHPTGFVRKQALNQSGQTVLKPVKGVRVRVWRWFTIANTYTNEQGFYRIPTRFNRLLIGNNAGFKVFFEGRHPSGNAWNINRTLFGVAPLWTLRQGVGYRSPNGHDITFNAGNEYWRAAVINTAIFDYITESRRDNLGLPPRNLTIVTGNRHGAPLLRNHISLAPFYAIPGVWTSMATTFFGFNLTFLGLTPDLIMPNWTALTRYNDIRTVVWHEMAHTCHFQRMRNDRGGWFATEWWSTFSGQTWRNSMVSGVGVYGYKGRANWQLFGLAEGWAFYRASLVMRPRYGLQPDIHSNSTFPRNYAFMFDNLARLGIPQSDLQWALSTWTIAGFRDNLISRHPNRRVQITTYVAPFL